MNQNQVPASARPHQVFYRPATDANPHPVCVDQVTHDADGTPIGIYSQQPLEEMRRESGSELLVADEATFNALHDASYTTQPEQISKEDYMDGLECLPPMQWGRWDGVESFRFSEFYSGNITTIYARTSNGMYWKFRDNAFMSGKSIAQKVQAAVMQISN